MSNKEMVNLCERISAKIYWIAGTLGSDMPKGIAEQKKIIEMIDEHPEILRVQIEQNNYVTVGMQAAMYRLFYVTMRALEDARACELKANDNETIYDCIRLFDDFRVRVVNSKEYADLMAKREARLASIERSRDDEDDLCDEYEPADYGIKINKYDTFDEDEDEDENMGQYDSILE